MVKEALNQVISVVICSELFAEEVNKVRDHDHFASKFRDSVHKDCNINLRLTKKNLVSNVLLLKRLWQPFDSTRYW